MIKLCKHLQYNSNGKPACAKGYPVKNGCRKGLMLCHEAKEENEDE